MINRILLRIKVIQILYAYYKGEDQDYGKAESELKESIEKTYDLYFYLLMLIPALTNYAKDLEEKSNKTVDVDLKKFINNKFAKQIAHNKMLLKYAEEHDLSWDEKKNTAIKNLFEAIIASECFQAYVSNGIDTYADDKDIWKNIYKYVIAYNEILGKDLEEDVIYWNADEETVFDFVLKTVKKYKEENTEDFELQPMYNDEESKTFGIILFKNSIYNGKEYSDLIDKNINTKKWDVSRIAFMDRLIMQTAIAELMSFPSIPVNVTLNEYIEIAKSYSTGKSNKFVNGVLDAVVTELRNSGKLMKVAYYSPENK